MLTCNWSGERRGVLASFAGLVLGTLSAGCGKGSETMKGSENEGIKSTKNFSSIESGYASTEEDWRSFLSCWRRGVSDRLAAKRGYSGLAALPEGANTIAPRHSDEVRARIRRAEEVAGARFPKSFVDFSIATMGRGWFIESMGEVDADRSPMGGLWPIEKIGRFRDVDSQSYETWMKNSPASDVEDSIYYRYGHEEDPLSRQDRVQFRTRYFPQLIMIGSLVGGTSILMNPAEVSKDGEMEVWYLSFKTFLERFRSFAELMQVLAYEDIINGSPGVYSKDELSKVPCVSLLKTAAI